MIPNHNRQFFDQLCFGWICPIALLSIYAVLGYAGLKSDSITFDELGHLVGGCSSWIERDHRLFQQNGQLPKRWGTLAALASEVRMPSTENVAWRQSDVDQFGHQFLYEMGNDIDAILLRCRTTMLVFGIVLGVVVFLWSNYLFGRVGACISLALCTFSPTLLAHGRLVTSDVTSALTFVVALLSLWEFLHRISIGRVVGCAAAIGLLFVSKMSGLLIVPMAAILIVLRLIRGLPLHVALPYHHCVVRKLSHQLVHLSAAILMSSAGALAVVWAFYDCRYSTYRDHLDGKDQFYREESIDSMTHDSAAGAVIRLARDMKWLPESYLFGLSHVLFHSLAHPAFMNGHSSRHGWTLFFPYAVLVKTPLPVFAIAAMAAWAAVPTIRDRKRSERRSGAWTRRISLSTYRTAPLWVFLIVYWTVALRVHLSIGERHVLATYPAVFILCGAAGRWIQDRNRVCTAILSTALICLAVETVRIRPNYLSYFNQLAGGPENGYRRLVDSSLDWGQDLRRFGQWLDSRRKTDAGGSPIYLSYFGSGDPACLGIEAVLLPGYLDWREEIDFRQLRPGTYCVSATMLQSVYGLTFGEWNSENERIYHEYLKRIVNLYGTHISLKRIRQGLGGEQDRLIYEFDQLRFARLCAHLRRREPDDRVAYSILVYNLSEDELEVAVGQNQGEPRGPNNISR